MFMDQPPIPISSGLNVFKCLFVLVGAFLEYCEKFREISLTAQSCSPLSDDGTALQTNLSQNTRRSRHSCAIYQI